MGRNSLSILTILSVTLLPILSLSFSTCSPTDYRLLVLLDDLSLKSSHSIFFNSFKSRGFDLDFKLADDQKLALQRYGQIWWCIGFSLATECGVDFDEVYMTDDTVLDLFKACPNIEVLKFEDCYGMENLRLCSEKLKRLDLSSFYTAERELHLELDCPNLVWLNIDCFEMGQFCVKNLSSLVEFHTFIVHGLEYYGQWCKVVKQLHRIAHIKHLVVQNWWLKLAPKDVFPKDFLLYNLKHLELQTGYTTYDLLGMAALLELCPNLETMNLDPLYKIVEDESLSEELLNKPINLFMPNLKEVRLKAYVPGQNQNQNQFISQFVSLLKKQGVVLEKIVLVSLYNGMSLPPVILRRRPPRAEVNEESSLHVEGSPER
ncbi:hypothetical protein H0E87_022898 [Populus deltoides]|uniref:Uncharacterized protein n=1 Tax=Populus deltoides TaxID=3696 RepID=A0A8T2XAG0_POPDE|nr:hypothetical protein H0E87_022898 [Populus deltoides]